MSSLERRVPLRFLVIGCGSIGKRHIANLAALNAGEILAYDVQSECRTEVTTKFRIEALETLQSAWAREPHVALVTAPTNLHCGLALEAARHGCHLFIEKPLSHQMDNLDDLLELVARRNLVTMVGCNMRFHPGPAMIKRLLKEGAIGKPLSARLQTGSFLPRWRPAQDYHQSYSASAEWGGAILDCIHEIDLALWYLGPARVHAAIHLPAQSIGLETDGLAEIILRHESGAVSSVHLNFVQRDYRRGCQIIGTEGTISWDFSEDCVRVFGPDGSLSESLSKPEAWQINQMYVDEMTHFLAAVRNGTQTMNPLEGGVAALDVALIARRVGRAA